MYDDDYCDDDNYNYDTFNAGPPPEPESYVCDNDSNPAEYFLESSRQLLTDSILCSDCVHDMGAEDDVQPLQLPSQ